MRLTAALTCFTVALFAGCSEKVDDPGGFGNGSNASQSGSGTDSESDGSSGSGSSGASDSATSTTSTSSSTSSTGTSSTSSTSSGSSSSTTGGMGQCGNGAIDAGEQCDGANLNGFDCTSLGYTGGTLACDAVTCTFDTSMCTSGTSGTSG